MYNPEEDGVTHINMYSKSKCELGKKLTNFAHTPFEHPKYGHFESVEGLWYFLKTGKIFEEFRKLYGIQAKKKGQSILKSLPGSKEEQSINEDFKEDIQLGIKAKLKSNPEILKELCLTELPLAHYYYWGDKYTGYTVKTLEKYDWITETFEDLRDITRKHWQDKGYIDENLEIINPNTKKNKKKLK